MSNRQPPDHISIEPLVMFELQSFSLLAALLVATVRLGVNPVSYFLKGICFNQLDKSALMKCTDSDVTKDKRNKKKRLETSDQKREPVTCQPTLVTDATLARVPFISIFRIFLALFLSCASLIVTAIVLSFTPLKSHSLGFLAPAALSFAGMILIAIMCSFSPTKGKLWQLGLPIICGMSIGGISRVFPTGQCDISLIFPERSSTVIAGFTAGAVLGSALCMTIVRFGKIKGMIAKPHNGLYKVGVFRKIVELIRKTSKTKVEFIQSLCPTNVFAYMMARFYIKQVPGWVIDVVFLSVEVMVSVLRIWVAKNCVQIWTLTVSVEGLVRLDDKRSTKAVNRAIRANMESIEAICPTFIAFLIHPCITLLMVLVYGFSWVAAGYIRFYTRVVSMFVIVACDFLMAYFVFTGMKTE